MQRKRKVVIVVAMQNNDDDIKQRVKKRIVLLHIVHTYCFVTYRDIHHTSKRNNCKQVDCVLSLNASVVKAASVVYYLKMLQTEPKLCFNIS